MVHQFTVNLSCFVPHAVAQAVKNESMNNVLYALPKLYVAAGTATAIAASAAAVGFAKEAATWDVSPPAGLMESIKAALQSAVMNAPHVRSTWLSWYRTSTFRSRCCVVVLPGVGCGCVHGSLCWRLAKRTRAHGCLQGAGALGCCCVAPNDHVLIVLCCRVQLLGAVNGAREALQAAGAGAHAALLASSHLAAQLVDACKEAVRHGAAISSTTIAKVCELPLLHHHACSHREHLD